MHVERNGSGPRVFFGLHGWSGDHRTYTPLLPYVPDDSTFLSADLPGCGASPSPADWTIGSIVSEVADTVRALEHPVTLVGNCSGANLALFVAQRLPQSIHRIVMIDAFAYWPWYFRVFTNRHIGRYAYLTTFKNPVGRWLTNLSLRAKRDKQTSLTEGFTQVDHTATYQYLRVLRDAGLADQFAGLTMPIDIVRGERSFAAVSDSTRIFQAMWPQSRSYCLPGAGHLPLLEATEALQQIVFHSHSDSREAILCTTSTATHAN